MKAVKFIFLVICFCFLTACPKTTDEFEPNYDESKVPVYRLPDPLVFNNGKPVVSEADWYNKRRPEILKIFEEKVYGKVPEFSFSQGYSLDDWDTTALNGTAIRKQVTVRLSVNDTSLDIHLLMYLPISKDPVPAFLGYNFGGNHTVCSDTAVFITGNWVMNDDEVGITDNRANAASRGTSSSRWPVELITGSGYALVTAYYGDVDPDFDDGFLNGIQGIVNGNKVQMAPDEWGSIAAWAWGLSRMLDYLETDPDIDARKVTVIGHSRLGKTALWAGAMDQRFAAVISNNSGCGGAALSMRQFGETVGRINTVFPHWFCDNFNRYNNNEKKLPVDQHMLIALMAPRPVYIASATKDLWADPKGEFLATVGADPVYRLLGLPGISIKSMPDPNIPVMDGRIGYHLRTGEHDVTPWDWQQYMTFVGKHLK